MTCSFILTSTAVAVLLIAAGSISTEASARELGTHSSSSFHSENGPPGSRQSSRRDGETSGNGFRSSHSERGSSSGSRQFSTGESQIGARKLSPQEAQQFNKERKISAGPIPGESQVQLGTKSNNNVNANTNTSTASWNRVYNNSNFRSLTAQ